MLNHSIVENDMTALIKKKLAEIAVERDYCSWNVGILLASLIVFLSVF